MFQKRLVFRTYKEHTKFDSQKTIQSKNEQKTVTEISLNNI